MARRELLGVAVEARLVVVNELSALAADRAMPLASVSGVAKRRLFLRLVPELCATVSMALRDGGSRDQRELIDELVGHPWFWQAPLGELTRDLTGLLDEYCDLVQFYAGWSPELPLRTESGNLVVPWRRSDDAVAADFVALRPPLVDNVLGDEYSPLGIDAQAVFEVLNEEYAGDLIGLRVIVGDGQAVNSLWLEEAQW